VAGFDLNLTRNGTHLKGRIGGAVVGKDVRLSSEAPPEVAALAAAIAFRGLEESAVGAGSN
jgi:hypothetical protein